MRLPITAWLLAAVVAVALAPAAAMAFDEPHNAPELHQGPSCWTCHPSGPATPIDSCSTCHFTVDPVRGKGPHGLYTDTTGRCDHCHTVHVAGGENLLSKTTVTESCNVCHDGTGGRGVYGTVFARTGTAPGAMHRIDTTSAVPGGSSATGGSATMAFKGVNGTLSCDDCHSPHDTRTLPPFVLERWRSSFDPIPYHSGYEGLIAKGTQTNRLLRTNPGDSAVAVATYGSDWCLACHAGRASGGALHNHPVDSKTSTATPFTYSNLVLLASDDATSVTTTGTLAYSNRGYLIPYPRTTGAKGQNAHAPICQQCHEDSRSVGELSAAGNVGDAATFQITKMDGVVATDNPRFQNFPHETVNKRLLVETDDDLCTNCHPPAVLP